MRSPSSPWLVPAGLAVLILWAIWLIGDDSFHVGSALHQHEPSFRIFRSLLELNLLWFATALSLTVWKTIVPESVIVQLLFQNPMQEQEVYFIPYDDDDEDDEEEALLFRSAYDRDAFEQHSDNNENDDSGRSESNNEEPVVVLIEEEEPSGSSEGSPAEGVFSPSRNVPVVDDNSLPVSISSLIKSGLENLLLILVTLFLFTLSSAAAFRSQHARDELQQTTAKREALGTWVSRIAAPTFPLLLFLYLVCYRAFFPWKRHRQPFWTVVNYTLCAPWYSPVTFRDGFIGDILTSSVRPMQDIAFTLCYLLFGLQGWWSDQYFHRHHHYDSYEPHDHISNSTSTSAAAMDPALFFHTADSRVPAMERSWLVHTLVLPLCTASPLWWRFLQNLRQTYDSRQRWPYLGNALKYFVAAQVAVFGVFHPAHKHAPLYLVSFVGATLYQIWWDVFMDWGLLVRDPTTGWYRFRPTRLYGDGNTFFYASLALVNVVLRFGWTLTFVPLQYLDETGVLTSRFPRHAWITDWVGPFLASAELIRRMLWGWLRLEWEVIKTSSTSTPAVRGSKSLKEIDDNDEEGIELFSLEGNRDGMTKMTLGGGGTTRDDPSKGHLISSMHMSSMNSIQVLAELGAYATAFCLLGLVFAAHRGTL